MLLACDLTCYSITNGGYMLLLWMWVLQRCWSGWVSPKIDCGMPCFACQNYVCVEFFKLCTSTTFIWTCVRLSAHV